MSSEERRWFTVFVYLQVLDVLSTLIGFSLGNTEASPFVRLMIQWGPVPGLVLSKAVALGLVAACVALKRTRLIRIINFWYAGLVLWNLFVVLAALLGPDLQARRAAEPGEAIQTVTAALRHNNSPMPNAGIYTAYQFASPANHAVTGSYGRFLQLVKTADYAPMLTDNPHELTELLVRGDHAEQTLQVRLKDGRTASYKIDVTRQAGGGWMVDGVSRLP
jgi:uncharacterized protein DUF4864/uncharacterized protein DUF5658